MGHLSHQQVVMDTMIWALATKTRIREITISHSLVIHPITYDNKHVLLQDIRQVNLETSPTLRPRVKESF